MNKENYISDIICQVLSKEKTKKTIYSVLNDFIPEYEPINLEHFEKIGDKDYIFKTEDELISYLTETKNISQSLYWNKCKDNPKKLMVGANITKDNMIVFSITFNGSQSDEQEIYSKLKRSLKSSIGVISYINPVQYINGDDFINRYQNKVYSFENK